MPRSFDMAADYRAGVEQVHRALSDEEYWRARLADSGADEAVLERLEISADGGIDVVTNQVLRSCRLPGVVSQFHRGDLAIRRAETWTPVVGSRADAAVAGSISGAPVSLRGTVELTPLPSPPDRSARMAFHAVVEVGVPLVGGKLENFIGDQLMALLAAEQRFTSAWIAERR